MMILKIDVPFAWFTLGCMVAMILALGHVLSPGIGFALAALVGLASSAAVPKLVLKDYVASRSRGRLHEEAFNDQMETVARWENFLRTAVGRAICAAICLLSFVVALGVDFHSVLCDETLRDCTGLFLSGGRY